MDKYYTILNYFTENEYISKISKEIPDSYQEIFKFIKEILIHPIEAKNRKIRFNQVANNREHAFISTVNLIMKSHPMKDKIRNIEILKDIADEDKLILSCDHFALLFTAILRNKGKEVRMRTGFVNYIIPNTWVPHWVNEVYSENGWNIVDSEREIESVKRESIITAGEAWLKRKDMEAYSYSGFSGIQGLKYALLCDINSILKNEMIGYHWRVKEFNIKKPKIMTQIYDNIKKEDLEKLDEISRYIICGEIDVEKLREMYLEIVPKESLIAKI